MGERLNRILNALVPLSAAAIWVSAAGAIAVAGLLVRMALPFLAAIPQPYGDFVVGLGAWNDESKAGELLIPFIALAVFVPMFLLLCTLLHRFDPCRARAARARRRGPIRPVLEIARAIAGSVAVLAGVYAVRQIFWQDLAILVGAMVIAAACIISVHLKRRHTGYYREVHARFMAAVLIPLFAVFSFVAVVSAIHLLSRGTMQWQYPVLRTAGAAVAALFFVTALAFALREGSAGARALVLLVHAVQIPLPLVCLKYWRFIYSAFGSPFVYTAPASGSILLWGGTIFLGAWSLLCARRAHVLPGSRFSARALVTPPALISITLMLTWSVPSYTALSADDFHLGETIIVWPQLFEIGQRQYRDFVSVQGLIGIWYGAVNALFFDNTAASYSYALLLATALPQIVTALVLWTAVGGLWALALMPFAIPLFDRGFFVVPVLMVLSLPALVKRPAAWCACYAVLAFLHIYWNTSNGAALTIALAPFFLYQALPAVRAVRAGVQARPGRWAGAAAGVAVAAIFAEPIGVGLLNFLRENGSTNTVAYGISVFRADQAPGWAAAWVSDPWWQRFWWELYRIGGWIIGAALALTAGWCALFTALRRSSRRLAPSRALALLTPALGSAAFALLLTPYCLGRIDMGVLSRTGANTMLVLACLFPLVCVFARRVLHRPAVPAWIVGAAIGIGAAPGAWPASTVIGRLLAVGDILPGSRFVRGSELGLPKLGEGYMPDARVDSIVRFKLAVDRLLAPGETYYDFTNASSYYYFVDKKVPGVYSANYLAANEAIQRRTLARLNEIRPPVVWVGPSINHDGAPGSLRSYRIYRWLLLNGYRLYDAAEFEFLVRKERLEERGIPLLEPALELEKLRALFHVQNLRSIPRAWGRSSGRLSARLGEVRRYAAPSARRGAEQTSTGVLRFTEGRPTFAWTGETSFAGKEIDFIAFDIERESASDAASPDAAYTMRAELTWDGLETPGTAEPQSSAAELEAARKAFRSFRFEAGPGTYIVPVGSHPGWLLEPTITKLRLQLSGVSSAARGATWRISVRLLKLER